VLFLFFFLDHASLAHQHAFITNLWIAIACSLVIPNLAHVHLCHNDRRKVVDNNDDIGNAIMAVDVDFG